MTDPTPKACLVEEPLAEALADDLNGRDRATHEDAGYLRHPLAKKDR